jgi:hypothetical protein
MKISTTLMICATLALAAHVGPKAYKQAQHDLRAHTIATHGE